MKYMYVSWGAAFPTSGHVRPADSDQPAHPCSLIKIFAGHTDVPKDKKCL